MPSKLEKLAKRKEIPLEEDNTGFFVTDPKEINIDIT